MATDTQEQQAKEFLQRTEIRTMKKDLKALREGDALKERNKIVNIKTAEEQRAEQQQPVPAQQSPQNAPEVLQPATAIDKSQEQEKLAEKDIKDYGTEQERQQIFVLESERFNLENQLEKIINEKEPALATEKNNLLSAKEPLQAKLNQILESEKKLQAEEKIVADQAQKSTIEAQKTNLEKARIELEDNIKELEKQRWAIEKEIETSQNRINAIDESSRQNIISANSIRDNIAGINTTLREVYSSIIARVEKEKTEKTQQRMSAEDAVKRAREEEQNKIQNQQQGFQKQNIFGNKEIVSKIPSPFKEALEKEAADEREQQKQFMADVEAKSQQDKKSTPENNTIQP